MTVFSGFSGLGGAARFAFRESRDGLKGFRVFAAALALGVAAIAGVGSMSAAFNAGLAAESRRLLGGDLEIKLPFGEIRPEARAMLAEYGAVSAVADAQIMARATDGASRTVVQLKGVDAAYPLFGALQSRQGADARPLLADPPDSEGAWPAVAEEALMRRLGVAPGELLRVGAATFRVRAVMRAEPDRATASFMLGPRLMTSLEGAAATGLIGTGGIVDRAYRLRLDDPRDLEEIRGRLEAAFPNEQWRLRDHRDATRGLGNMLDNLQVFMTMTGLAALVIGGVGAANAVRAYLLRKLPVIATLKCLGAEGAFVFRAYLLQVLFVSMLAIGAGLAIGAMAPLLVQRLFAEVLPFSATLGFYGTPLLRAAAFGALVAVIFSIWPLAQARQTPAARLFQDLASRARRWPRPADLAAIALAVALFFALAIGLAPDRQFAAIFAGGGVVAYLVLRLTAAGLVWGARRAGRPKRPSLRAALASLTRPGAATGSIVVSLGLGLTLLAAVSLIDVNLTRAVAVAFPARAPTLYFADIPFDQTAEFDALIAEFGPDEFQRFPMMRAGVAAINGVAVSEVEGARKSPWVRQGDWGVSYMAPPPAPETLVAGEWWAETYDGSPIISLSDWQAETLGLGVGDKMTLAIGGRLIEAEIANLREVQWGQGGLDFVAIFAPGTLEAARPTSIASLRLDGLEAEEALFAAVARRFPEVTMIRTREAVQPIVDLLNNLTLAVRVLSGVTIAAGILVLLGAMATDYRSRLYAAMVMKSLGARRSTILAAQAVEYLILGLAPALLALGLSSIAAYVVIDRLMELDWSWPPGVLLTVVFGAAGLTLALGLGGAWRILDARPWPILRSD